MRSIAPPATLALYAITCGSSTVWVAACGRPNEPPRTWHSLWCRPIPTVPRQVPASHAPVSASYRAAGSSGRATIAGSARASMSIACTATPSATGLACGAYSASTACAIALIPLVTDSATGMPTVRSTS